MLSSVAEFNPINLGVTWTKSQPRNRDDRLERIEKIVRAPMAYQEHWKLSQPNVGERSALWSRESLNLFSVVWSPSVEETRDGSIEKRWTFSMLRGLRVFIFRGPVLSTLNIYLQRGARRFLSLRQFKNVNRRMNSYYRVKVCSRCCHSTQFFPISPTE